MKIIKAELKGFHFVGFEIGLLEEIGFNLKGCFVGGEDDYLVVKNPAPIEATTERIKMVRELRHKMYAIKIEGVDE